MLQQAFRYFLGGKSNEEWELISYHCYVFIIWPDLSESHLSDLKYGDDDDDDDGGVGVDTFP